MILREKREKRKKGKFPSFFSGRIILVTIILFFLLTSSIYLNIFIKAIIPLISKQDFKIESLFDNKVQDLSFEKRQFTISRKLLFSIFSNFIYITIIFVIISLPFKIYFHRKKKNKQIGKNLENFVKKFILKTPITFSLIYLIFFVTFVIFSILTKQTDEKVLYELKDYAIDTIIITIIATIASAIFIYSWQSFRVQQYYLKVVYSFEELKYFPVNKHFNSIRYKLLPSFMVTTILPLIFLFFAIYLNIDHINEIDRVSKTQLKMIFGSFSEIILKYKLNSPEFYNKLQKALTNAPFLFIFYSSLDTILMFYSITSTLVSSLIYIFFFIRFNTLNIINPISRLIKSMDKIANNDFSAYTHVETNDEIGQLVVGYNKMLDGLNEKEKIKDLFGQYLTKEISDKILSGQININGELYESTILFSDIRDFTKLTENISPTEIVSFLNEYFDKMIEVAVKYDGIIDKFIGDGMLVVFGIPIKIEDHATKALMASIEMQKEIYSLNEKRITEGKFPIKIGIGLHSGTILAGNIGNKRKLQYTVIGDTVNVASRIENLNKQFSSSILMTGETYKKLDLNLFDSSHFILHKDVEIRGKSERFNLYSYQS